MTEPYPWPWDAAFRPERLCLLVLGAQRREAASSIGAAPVSDGICDLARAVREAGATVAVVRHTGGPGRRPHLLGPDDDGWGLVLEPHLGDVVVDAGGHDAFHDSRLDAHLRSRRVDLLALCGLAQEVAVDSTCRSANDRGFECLTLSDLVAPLGVDTGAHALSSITMSGGIFGAIGTSDELRALLAGDTVTHSTRRPHLVADAGPPGAPPPIEPTDPSTQEATP